MQKLSFLLVVCILYSTIINACGIVGYVGNNRCKVQLLTSLGRLEYRGYDSAGIALIDQITQDIVILKKSGKLQVLKEFAQSSTCDGCIGIGHTRWATHGLATEVNAHPHISDKVVIVHNGVIENQHQLKKELLADGYLFVSQTDTEIMAHLFDAYIKRYGDITQALCMAMKRLEGACTCVVMHKDYKDRLFAVRHNSPLCIGVSQDGMYIASDFLAFADKTNNICFMPEKSLAVIALRNIELYNYDEQSLPLELKEIYVQPSAYEKLEHEHFMLKEIYEQKTVIERTIAYYQTLGDNIWQYIGLTKDKVRDLSSLNLFGCGTSWHAARIGQFFFETIANIPTSVHLASEFRYMKSFFSDNSLFIGISQSGETSDTIDLVKYFKQLGNHVVALTNVENSTMIRESHGYLLTKAGPEIAVASTKAFSTQLAALYWLAHRIALEKGLIDQSRMLQAEHEICHAAQVLEQVIEQYKVEIIAQASHYAKFQRVMYLGRHVTYPFALEGALKLKEISYIFAQGYPAGELKHGSIALIDDYTPVILFSHQDPVLYAKLVANAQEVKARKGNLLVVAFQGQDEIIQLADKAYIIPPVAPLLEPLAMTGFMQFFAYQVALVLGRDIDKPRNLAKAVTVE